MVNGAQRVKKVGRNNRVSALIETGRTVQDIKRLLIQGDADVITEPEEVLPLMRDTARSRGTPEELACPARTGQARRLADYPGLAQRCDVVRGVPQFGEDLVAVLAQGGRWALRLEGRLAHLERRSDHAHRPDQ